MGENNEGVASRWYPLRLMKRLADLEHQSDRIVVFEGDGVAVLEPVASLPRYRMVDNPALARPIGRTHATPPPLEVLTSEDSEDPHTAADPVTWHAFEKALRAKLRILARN